MPFTRLLEVHVQFSGQNEPQPHSGMRLKMPVKYWQYTTFPIIRETKVCPSKELQRFVYLWIIQRLKLVHVRTRKVEYPEGNLNEFGQSQTVLDCGIKDGCFKESGREKTS